MHLEVIHQRCAAGMINLPEGKERNLHRQTSLIGSAARKLQLYVIICQYTVEQVKSSLWQKDNKIYKAIFVSVYRQASTPQDALALRCQPGKLPSLGWQVLCLLMCSPSHQCSSSSTNTQKFSNLTQTLIMSEVFLPLITCHSCSRQTQLFMMHSVC